MPRQETPRGRMILGFDALEPLDASGRCLADILVGGHTAAHLRRLVAAPPPPFQAFTSLAPPEAPDGKALLVGTPVVDEEPHDDASLADALARAHALFARLGVAAPPRTWRADAP